MKPRLQFTHPLLLELLLIINSFIPSEPMLCVVDHRFIPVSPYRWAWGSAEEDLHQMGELSPGPGDLSHRRPVHGLARRPHADPPPGGPLRRTAGQCGSTEARARTHSQTSAWPTPTLQGDRNPASLRLSARSTSPLPHTPVKMQQWGFTKHNSATR